MRLSAAHASRPAAVTRARARSGVSPTISRTKPPRAPAQLGGSALLVALPERQLAGQPRRRRHEHTIVRDVLDAPRRRAEGEDVADARLVDHLLVELAHTATRPLARGEEHGIQPAVRDRSATRHREALGAAATGEGVGQAVPARCAAAARRTRRRGSGRRACPGWPRGPSAAGRRSSRPGGRAPRRRRRSSRPWHTSRRSAARARRRGWPGRAATRWHRRACARPRRRSARGRRGTWGRARPRSRRPPGGRRGRPAAARSPPTEDSRPG